LYNTWVRDHHQWGTIASGQTTLGKIA
jgi:hypothetical protein